MRSTDPAFESDSRQPLGAQTKQGQAFLDANLCVRLHFTSTYSSWLNQVELWFRKIERDAIAGGILTSKHDLARKLRRYIGRDNYAAKLFRWTYADTTKRIAQSTY